MKYERRENYNRKCLIELLSAIVNQHELPEWDIWPDWAQILKISELHNITNLLYYATIAWEDKSLTGVKEDILESYRQAVIREEKSSQILDRILDIAEKEGVSYQVRGDFFFRDFYPQKEMASIQRMSLFIDKKREHKLQAILHRFYFEKQEHTKEGGRSYRKVPGIKVDLYTEAAFLTKKTRKMFAQKIGKQVALNLEQMYVYHMIRIAELFSHGEIQMRHALDFWCFYEKNKENLDLEKCQAKLSGLGFGTFHIKFVKLLHVWFQEHVVTNEETDLFAMEAYIFSKGLEAREVCCGIIPLHEKKADIYLDRKELKKKKKQKQHDWLFPSIDYMEAIFPKLKNNRKLLWVYYGRRLFRLALNNIKMKVKRR